MSRVDDKKVFFFTKVTPNIQNAKLDNCVHISVNGYLKFSLLPQLQVLHIHAGGAWFTDTAMQVRVVTWP